MRSRHIPSPSALLRVALAALQRIPLPQYTQLSMGSRSGCFRAILLAVCAMSRLGRRTLLMLCESQTHCRAGDSSKLITGSADASAMLWDLASGKQLHTFKYHEPCRAVAFSTGDGMAAISSDPFMGVPSCIYLVSLNR